MDKLWAPWRTTYVTKIVKEKDEDVFGRIYRDKKNDKKNYVIKRSAHSFSVMNIFPYNAGHMLIVPNRKVADLTDLRKEELDDLMALLLETKKILDNTLKPHGYNIGLNLGRYAGAGFPDHLHFHVVPRWKGDSNFMQVVGNTKVISHSLNALYKTLKNAYKKRH